MGKKGRVASCDRCPKNVREELWVHYREKEQEKKREIGHQSEQVYLGDLGFSDGEAEEDEVERSSSSSKKGKGTLDLWVKNPQSAIDKRKKDNARQTNIREAVDKEVVARVHQYIARFWYQAGLSFNSITLQSFKDMLDAVGAYGRNLPASSYHGIKVPLLKKELDHTNKLLQKNRDEWKTHGCSIMSDGWTDRRQRTIINFLVNSPLGTVFVKSVDGSSFVKTGEKLFELLDELVEEIGEENVVQVVTDNGSNYVAAGKLLMEKRSHLYWTPCAAHCIDLILEDIGKIPVIKNTIRRGVKFVGFIYNHTSTLSLMRQFTNKRELVRPAVTRFATSFLSLERIHKEKGNLGKMFTFEEWTKNKLSKEAKGKYAMNTALMPTFWKNVVYTLKVMAPLVKVLRLVDGDKRPTMGYIYEAMDKAKETIAKAFNNNELRYKEVFSIIDSRWDCQLHRPLHAAGHFLNPAIYYDNNDLQYDMEVVEGLYASIRRLVPDKELSNKIMLELKNYKNRVGLFGDDFAEQHRKIIDPTEWWSMYGHAAPNLQKVAIKILGLTCSASGCERNLSVFEQIHSKKRNRLEHRKLHDLVYVKYNQKLVERHNKRAELDPISLDDIDDCNEWLVGEVDDENVEGDDTVFENEPLDWETVYEASGVGEPITYTRHTTSKRKEVSSSGSSSKASGASASKKKTRTPTSSRSKRLETVLEDEECEFEEDHETSDEESEGEDGEGFAAWDDDKEEEDYMDLDDDEIED